MPELPEVEVLVRHLGPLLHGKRIRAVAVLRPKLVRPATPDEFARAITGRRFASLGRRGKYLVFTLHARRGGPALAMLGHLGMTGRMQVQPARASLPRHAGVVFDLGRLRLVYSDTRYFGRCTLDTRPLAELGPEPLGPEFTIADFARRLARSHQAIKVRLLDQSLVAGVGNIYASEALFRARVSPRLAACRLDARRVGSLWRSIRAVLAEAIAWGSAVPLNWDGAGRGDGVFYYGLAPGTRDYYEERLLVYDRAGQPCPRCRAPIQRIVQAARSTFFCPRCQRGRQ